MSSPAADLRGVQEPRVALLPEAVWSDVDDAAFLASSYGLTPDPWQLRVLRGWLGRTADGRLSATRCGLAVPRQNGKNGCLEVRELFGMVVRGEKFLHTAHEVKTARKAFLRLVSFFENPHFPELEALVKDVRRTNGQEAILLTNGGSVEFVARSRGSGRGFTVDVLVLDEAQELTDEQLEALMPTISAAPLGDPQIVLTGTPPPPGSPGEVFVRTRKRAHDGDSPRLCWHEWSIDSDDVDVHDRQVWAEVNPALGFRLLATTIEDELETLSLDGFLRERLGLWVEQGVDAVISETLWAECATTTPPTEGRVGYGLDMTPDRLSLSISAVRVADDGSVHGETVKHGSAAYGTSWAVDWLAERWQKATSVVVDAQSPAMSLVHELEKRGVRVTVTGSRDMVKACGMFLDAVRDGTFTHFDQPVLNVAALAATKRAIGQAGGWGWDRKDPSVDVSPLVSVTLALFGVRTATRRPGRKSRMVVMS